MLKIEKYGKFHNFEKNKKKKQIILCHSFRNHDEYLNSLKYRLNGKYDKIPNYFITKNGEILNATKKGHITDSLYLSLNGV
jgi:hypothetical protein